MPILDTKVLTETEDSDLWEFEEELGSTATSNKHPVHCDEKVTQLWHLIHPNSITRDRFHFFRHGNQETSLFTSSDILQPELSAYQKNIPKGHHGQRTYTPPTPNSRRIGTSSYRSWATRTVMANWKPVTSAPRSLGGAISLVYTGAFPDNKPTEKPAMMRPTSIMHMLIASSKTKTLIGILVCGIHWMTFLGIQTLKLWAVSGHFRKHLVWPSWKVATNIAT